MSDAPIPIEVFCSYVPEDESFFQQLQAHLSVLTRQERIVLWNRRRIIPGTDWTQAIDAQVNHASVILLLISAYFVNSDYCYGVEMKRALERHKNSEARVIPILLRPFDWQSTPFAKLKVLPSNEKPITEWRNRQKAFVDIAQGIRQAIEYLMHVPKSVSPIPLPKIWNIPYARNRFFTGREQLLDLLHEKLTKEENSDATVTNIAALTQPQDLGPQAIKGLGGIGKTQIAVEYAYRYRDRYPIMLWVNAVTEETLISSFVTIADILPSLPGKDETDQKKVVEAVKRWLEQCNERWLLIFDNADDIVLVRDFLPKVGKGHVVLTTRAHAVASIAAASIEVEKMGLIEGSCLLLRRAYGLTYASDEEVFEHVSVETVNEAGNIVIALDYLPLALDQAGAYIEETQSSLSHYLVLYQTHRTKLLVRRGIESSNYPLAVATTWSLSFQKVEVESPAAAELLRLCAFLAPDAIPEELIRNAASRWRSPLRKRAADPFLLDQMIATLHKFSLVKRSEENNTLSIHRLVQAALIDAMKQYTQRQWAKRVILAINDVFPDPNDVALWPRCLRYLSQVQVCFTLMDQYMLMLIEAAHLLHQAGVYMLHHALYTAAQPLMQRALAIREQQLGVDHPDTITNLDNLAGLYYDQGQYSEAELLYRRTLALYEQQLGADHPNTVQSYNNLADLYMNMGKHVEAELFYQHTLAICEQHLGADYPNMANSLNNLAGLYYQQGKYAEAEVLCKRALSICEQHLGLDHPTTANSLNISAMLYLNQGEYAKAEPLLVRVLAICEKKFESSHLNMAVSLNNLAEVYRAQGKYTEAEPLYQRALAICERRLGANHPSTANSLNNMAGLYDSQGKYVEAEPLYQRALAIREQQFGTNHLDTDQSLNNLGMLYLNQGEYAKAEPLLVHLLAIFEEQYGPDHFYTAVSLNNLAGVYYRQGKYTEAESSLVHALAICKQQVGVDHPYTALVHNNLTVLYDSREKYAEVEPLSQHVLITREQYWGRITPTLLKATTTWQASIMGLVPRSVPPRMA